MQEHPRPDPLADEQARIAERLQISGDGTDERSVLLDGETVALVRFDGQYTWDLFDIVEGELRDGLDSMMSGAGWNDELERWAVGFVALRLAQDRLEGGA